MDLQAILDASDSSSSNDDDEYYHSQDFANDRRRRSDPVVDLEAILGASDDDEEEEDDENDHRMEPALTTSSSAIHRFNTTPSASHHHSASDWAILQSILHSGDEEDQVEGASPFRNKKKQQLDSSWTAAEVYANASFDDDLEEDVDEDDARITTTTRETLLLADNENDDDDRFGLVERTTAMSLGSPLTTNDKSSTASLVLSSSTPRLYQNSQQQQQQQQDTSRRALQYAQKYEHKLLQAGRRDMVSPLKVKRNLKPKIVLRARETTAAAGSNTNNNNNSISSWSLATTSGLVERKPLAAVSASIEKHASLQQGKTTVYCGLPTCLAFNSKFIAIGTQQGIVLVYDLFEVLRQRLGATAYFDNNNNNNTTNNPAGANTSVDLSANGETILAGHTNGMVVLWDTIRGVVLKTVADVHVSPLASVRFLPSPQQGVLSCISVDVGGLVHRLVFRKNMLWTTHYSLETDCLLDGTAGQILATHVLPPWSTVKPQLRPDDRFVRKLSLLALSSERSSFAVAVDPQIHVLHRWAKPPQDKVQMRRVETSLDDDDSEPQYLPCLAWGWGLVAGGGHKVMPILARAWGCCLQLLGCTFPTLSDNTTKAVDDETEMHWPAFGVQHEVDTEAPVVALKWLDNRSLMYLTVTNEFTLIDTVMMTLLERLDFSGFRLVYAEFALSRSSSSKNTADATPTDDATALSTTTFENSIRYSDDRLMVLCKDQVKCISVVGARRRIATLEEDGEWLEALALALDHFESTVISQEDRKRDHSGIKDLSHHPDLFRAKNDEEEWLSNLLVRYLNLAVENAPEPTPTAVYGKDPSGATNDLAHSHYQMLAGVCIEYCVVTRKSELLFNTIFQRFHEAGYSSVFLDVLEPYVLNDKLPYIGAEAMSFFVEHCKATNDIATVERCLLHMDCSIMDFDTILSLLRKNEMFTALFYVFNTGLDDFVSPLEILLEKLFDFADVGAMPSKRRSDGVPVDDFERFGYKALLYLKTSFAGKTFPREKEIVPEEKRRSVKRDVLFLLMRKKYQSAPYAKKKVLPGSRRSLEFPYMRLFLLIDARGLLDSLEMALDASDDTPYTRARSESTDDWVQSGDPNDSDRMPSDQEVIEVLAAILRPSAPSFQTASLTHPSAINAFLDFTARYIMQGSVTVDRDTTYLILSRMSSMFAVTTDPVARQKAQKQAMDLLSSSPNDAYDPDQVLEVINKAGMHRAALLLHQQVASSWKMDSTDDMELRAKHFQSAIDCYIEDDDPDFRKEVYPYVKKECAGVGKRDDTSSQPTTLREALFMKLTALCRLDPLMTASLVADLFVDELDQVVDSLGSSPDDQFSFLHSIASGSLAELDPVAGSVLVLTMEHYHTYLALMAKQHPEMVYDYLSSHDNYRTEECLALCEEHDIPDATVYLLERTDKINEALRLGLQTLESRMMDLKRTIRGMELDSLSRRGARDGERSKLPSKQDRAVDDLKRMLVVVLDVCERKSHAHGSKLWFNVLDRLITAKGFLRLSKEQPQHAKVMADVLSDLLRLTMQRMVSSVPLTDLVHKVTTHNSGSNLGELREMVESLLGTYNFELDVFQGAAKAFQQDQHAMKTEFRRLVVQGARVDSVLNCPLQPETVDEVSAVVRQPANHEAALQVGGYKSASLVPMKGASYTQKAESRLSNALSRLRDRRQGTSKKTSYLMGPSDDDFEPAVYEPRLIGALGDAEHRGRLVMF